MEDLMQSILVIYIFASNIQNINQKTLSALKEAYKTAHRDSSSNCARTFPP